MQPAPRGAPRGIRKLPAKGLERLAERLHDAQGLSGYQEAQQWLEAEYGQVLPYSTVHTWVRYTHKAKLKRPRPSHPKKTLPIGRTVCPALNVLVVDNAPAHTALTLSLPDHVVLLFLPPYCPELNPIERLWEDLKSRISATDQTVRTELNALREHVAQIINRYTLEQLRSLTGYGYILEAIRSI